MVGIAIINYRTYEKTIECIDSIRENVKVPYKIYLLENGSKNDSSKKLLHKYEDSKDVKVLISKQNLGYARGNNLCINYMLEDDIEYGIISNNDILCKKQTIEKLIDDLKNNDNLLLVGPKIYSPSMEFQCSARDKNIEGYGYLFNSMYISGLWKKSKIKNEKKWNNVKDVIKAEWISGAFFAFSIKNMKKVNFFDSNTFLFFEEAILANKAKKRGLELAFDPTVMVIHDHAFSTGGGLNIVSKIAADKSERYYFKNYVKASEFFLFLLKKIRDIEVLYSFGKRKQFNCIKQYFMEMKLELEEKGNE